MRNLCLQLHRYLGLLMAGFLILAGVTGSTIVWYDELDAWAAPQLRQVPLPSPDAKPLPVMVIRERVAAQLPEAETIFVPLQILPGQGLRYLFAAKPDPVTGKTAALPYDEVFVNPYTGAILGQRQWGNIRQGQKNLIPFLYRLHDSLALGEFGGHLFGIIALLWTLDCFIGAYLSFPISRKKSKAGIKHWLRKWWPSWQLRLRPAYKLNFDMHRAGGLWLWLMLLVMAWSSVAMNLDEVYEPIMRTIFSHQPEALPRQSAAQNSPGLNWTEAAKIGRQHMVTQARQHGFKVLNEYALRYEAKTASFSYRVRSDRDLAQRWGSTIVRFDANTGQFIQLWLPTGGASGDTIRTWLISLHMAALWGIPWRIIISLIGVLVILLSITGLVIWAKKRRARKKYAQQLVIKKHTRFTGNGY